jgi:putative acetyltransferase
MPIRPYQDEDLVQLFDIYAQSKLDELKYEKLEPSEQPFTLLPLDQDPKRLFELMESDIYVSFADQQIQNSSIQGSIQGFGALYGNEIRALFVHPECRGLGIGKQLLEFLLQQISGEAQLYVAQSNYPAKQLYGAYGFKVDYDFETSYNGRAVMAQRMSRPEQAS